MKPKWITISTLLFLGVIALQSCFKDTVVEHYTFYRPIYKSREAVRAEIKSGPAQPVRNPGKLFVRGHFIFLNDINRGIHVINYANPAAPQNVAFINIPGNVDLAVNGDFLYADQYTDLVTLNISNPLQVTLTNVDEKVFPSTYYVPDSSLVLAGWLRVDTTVKRSEAGSWLPTREFGNPFVLNSAASAAGGGSAGKAGSMARFGMMQQRLYTVSHAQLKVFNISNGADPVFTKEVWLGAGDIETIYPFRNNLFIGSMSGMHIYSVADPDNPTKTGLFTHATACDPVVADDQYAYVTLRTGTFCTGVNNQMDVVDVTNLSNPTLLKTYPFTNPHGLDKDGNYIFLCDGSAGLRVLNASQPNNITTIRTITGMHTYDVVAWNNLAITVAKDGLYLVDYSNINDTKVISKIPAAR